MHIKKTVGDYPGAKIKKNELIVDSSQLAYGLTTNTMKQYLDVVLGSGNNIIGDDDDDYEYDNELQMFIKKNKIIKIKKDSEITFSLENYIIM